MQQLGQQFIGGLAMGSIYALVAVGLVLVYKVSDVVNFAHGTTIMVTTFVALKLVDNHVPLVLAFLAAMAAGAGLGAAVHGLVLQRARNATVTERLVATIGVGFVLYSLAGLVWGYDTRGFPEAVTGTPVRLAAVVISRDKLLTFGTAVVLAVALFLFFRYNKAGIALRAMAQNQTAARLMGVPVNRMLLLTWAISAALGALAGVLIAPNILVDPNMMDDVLVKAFAAAVLGGFTSLPGALVGGLGLGVIENFVAASVKIGAIEGTEFKATFAFLLIIAVLAIRPEGLFGRAQVKKV
ncbi:MAG TPA: branched-chain amino acid ABC transporter permease [Chloroflexota bacterium]|nr:branched-chain amino acid ABC transporter permease [Chloroflexota bacterium]